jgi:hypothetical protein
MAKDAGESTTNTLNRVIELLVDHQIKLDALEQVLKETNPLVHELYVGTIENLQAQKATELKSALTASSNSALSDG